MHYCKLTKPLDRDVILAGLPEGVKADLHQSERGGSVKLTPPKGEAAWGGVTVYLEAYHPRLPDGTAQYDDEAWRVEIGWPSCGSQDIQRTQGFIRLLEAAVLVAQRIEDAVKEQGEAHQGAAA